MRLRFAVVASALACFVVACSGPPSSPPVPRSRTAGVDGTPPGKGTQLAPGKIQDARVTPDGQWLVYLEDVKHPKVEGLPPVAVVGDLYAVPVAGGAAHRLATGVTNLPGGFLFTPDSKWVLLRASFDVALQAGQLQAVRLGDFSTPSILGNAVTSLAVSADSQTLAWIENGVMRRMPLGGGERTEVAGGVALAEFSPDGRHLFYRRTLAAGGGLFVTSLKAGDAAAKLGEQVGDFKLSLDSKTVAFTRRSEESPDSYELWVGHGAGFKPERVARGVGSFAFSADSRYLARTENGRPDVLGDLVVGPAPGGAGRKIGERVQDFGFAPDSSSIALTEHYDSRSRVGTLTVVTLPEGKPRLLAKREQNYEWSADGKFLAFLAQIAGEQGIYSSDLLLASTAGEAAPIKVGDGVFGYGFGDKGQGLFLRTHCTREGRACDLRRVDLEKPAQQPAQIAEGVYSFHPAPSGEGMLITYARLDSDAYDLAVTNWKTRAFEVLDHAIVLPAFWAGPSGKDVVYAVLDRSRAGVYRAPAQK